MADPFEQTSRTYADIGRLSREEIGKTLPFLFQKMMGTASPIFSQMEQLSRMASQGAAAQGARFGQDIQASLGALGGGTGVGAVTRSLAGSLASNQALQARMGVMQQMSQFMQSIFGGASQGAMDIVGGIQQGALGQIQQAQAETPWWQALLGAGASAIPALAPSGSPKEKAVKGGGTSYPTPRGPR